MRAGLGTLVPWYLGIYLKQVIRAPDRPNGYLWSPPYTLRAHSRSHSTLPEVLVSAEEPAVALDSIHSLHHPGCGTPGPATPAYTLILLWIEFRTRKTQLKSTQARRPAGPDNPQSHEHRDAVPVLLVDLCVRKSIRSRGQGPDGSGTVAAPYTRAGNMGYEQVAAVVVEEMLGYAKDPPCCPLNAQPSPIPWCSDAPLPVQAPTPHSCILGPKRGTATR
jgi:hypothetical protein